MKIEWTSDQEDELSDSPPHTLEEQPPIEVEESPAKTNHLKPKISAIDQLKPVQKAKLSHTNPKTVLKTKSRASWSPKIDFPDDITIKKPVSGKAEGGKKKRLFPEDAFSGSNNSGKSTQVYCPWWSVLNVLFFYLLSRNLLSANIVFHIQTCNLLSILPTAELNKNPVVQLTKTLLVLLFNWMPDKLL